MPYIDKDFVQNDLKPRINIVEVITSLCSDKPKKSGSSYSCCCPFHFEKTPSFHIFTDTQTYKCFGCQVYGDAISFVMNFKNCSYPEAIEDLSDMTGLDVKYLTTSETHLKQIQLRKGYLELMEQAASLFEDYLQRSPEALYYAKEVRGLSDETIRKARIGYAPDNFTYVDAGLVSDHNDTKSLLELGILKQKENGSKPYPFFRNRLMIPITNDKGQVIAFGGRILNSDDEKAGPKYLNSPESELFHKSKVLYGWHEAKKCKPESIIVVEGYMDAIALREAGFNNVVATLGTAITSDHVTTLYRNVDTIINCFDGDKAGIAATWRALENITPNLNDIKTVKFAQIPQGYDPDVLVRKFGKAAFEDVLSKARSYADVVIDHFVEQKIQDPYDNLQIAQCVREIAGVVKSIPSIAYQISLVETCKEKIAGSDDILERMLNDEKSLSTTSFAVTQSQKARFSNKNQQSQAGSNNQPPVNAKSNAAHPNDNVQYPRQYSSSSWSNANYNQKGSFQKTAFPLNESDSREYALSWSEAEINNDYQDGGDLDLQNFKLPQWLKLPSNNGTSQQSRFNEFLINLSNCRNMAVHQRLLTDADSYTIINKNVDISKLDSLIYKFIGLMIQKPDVVIRLTRMHDKGLDQVFTTFLETIYQLNVIDSKLAQDVYNFIVNKKSADIIDTENVVKHFAGNHYDFIVKYLAGASFLEKEVDLKSGVGPEDPLKEVIDTLLELIRKIVDSELKSMREVVFNIVSEVSKDVSDESKYKMINLQRNFDFD